MSVSQERKRMNEIADLKAQLAATKAAAANGASAEDVQRLENTVNTLRKENKTLKESNTNLAKKITKLEQAIETLSTNEPSSTI